MKAAIASVIHTVELTSEPETVEYQFDTAFGTVDVLAELSIDGDAIVLSEVCITRARHRPFLAG